MNENSKTQIFYEIAMSIGGSFELKTMLKTCLSVYMKKLNFSSAQIFVFKENADPIPCFSIPRVVPYQAEIKDCLRDNPALQSYERVKQQHWPLQCSVEGTSYQIFLLQGFGFLILGKSGQPHHEPIYRSLLEVNEKLSAACIACRQKEDLLRAKEEAETASHAKSEFMANMSHELRTPLNAIMGFAELALDMAVDPEQKEFLEVINLSANRLTALVNDVLDISKIESGKVVLYLEDFVIKEFLESVIKLFQGIAKNKNIKLRLQIDPNVPKIIHSDQQCLKQILMNLLNNAFKFTKKGVISLNVSEVQKFERQCSIQFSVSDTGIGVQKEKLEYIFESFTQADNSSTKHFGGTGLGLTICKKLVELVNGSMWLHSDEGEGSTFSFSALVGEPYPEAAHPQKLGDRPMALDGVRILLVEDNIQNQKLAAKVLHKGGAHVDIAGNGAQAIEILAAGSHQVILMDVGMPVMDGLEATKKIRSGDPEVMDIDIPIIAMTANAYESDRGKCIDAGMTDFLSKPMNRQLLFEAIQKNIIKS